MEIATFIGELFSFNSSLKLYHWSVTRHRQLWPNIWHWDEAIASLLDVIDRITETTYALVGDLHISIPETKTPDNITKHVSEFYNHVPLIFSYGQNISFNGPLLHLIHIQVFLHSGPPPYR
mgnify:CR=1 FL=1